MGIVLEDLFDKEVLHLGLVMHHLQWRPSTTAIALL